MTDKPVSSTARSARPEERRDIMAAGAPDVTDAVIGEGSGLHPVDAEAAPFRNLNLVVAIDSPEAARALIVSLERAGVDADHISYVALAGDADDTADRGAAGDADRGGASDGHGLDEQAYRDVTTGAAKGLSAGAAVGALAGVALLLVPGIGTVAGAGILGAVLGGASAGGSVGGIWGAFSNAAESGAWERTFADVRAGRVLVGVHTDDEREIERVRPLLGDDAHAFDAAGNSLA